MLLSAAGPSGPGLRTTLIDFKHRYCLPGGSNHPRRRKLSMGARYLMMIVFINACCRIGVDLWRSAWKI